ncbi:hypothetical protein L2E82_50124 [Cichorium intybus]|nr:hypothetical protein L2E82_50124 [Cichorium intybus]
MGGNGVFDRSVALIEMREEARKPKGSSARAASMVGRHDNNAVLAYIILKERLHIFGVVGCALCVVGSTTIVLHAPEERAIESVTEVWDLATEPGYECERSWYCFEAYFFRNQSISVSSNMIFYLLCSALCHYSNELFKQENMAGKGKGIRTDYLSGKWNRDGGRKTMWPSDILSGFSDEEDSIDDGINIKHVSDYRQQLHFVAPFHFSVNLQIY